MKKLYRQIRMLSVVAIFIIFSFIIHSYFTVTVSSLGKRRYRSIGNRKYMWNRLLGHNMETCLRQKRRFWSKVLKDFNESSSWNCLRRGKNKTGLFSYFVMESFEDIRCLNKTIQLSKTDMPQVRKFSTHRCNRKRY